METYNPKDSRNWHEIKYTLQHGKYKGWFTTEVGGTCRGADLLIQIFLLQCVVLISFQATANLRLTKITRAFLVDCTMIMAMTFSLIVVMKRI